MKIFSIKSRNLIPIRDAGKLSYNIEILPNKCDVMDDYIHKKIYEVNKLYHTDQNIIPLFNDLNDVFNVVRNLLQSKIAKDTLTNIW